MWRKKLEPQRTRRTQRKDKNSLNRQDAKAPGKTNQQLNRGDTERTNNNNLTAKIAKHAKKIDNGTTDEHG